MRLPTLALLLAAACTRGDSSRAADTAGARDTSAAASAGAPAPDTVASPWAVSEAGAGPIRAGMTSAEARAATGGALALPVSLDATCDFARVAGAPGGLRIMMAGGRVARVDVDSATVPTTRGARVGDTEARVRELYGSALREEPHKYVEGGRYLIVRGADTTRAIVFETDGRVVRHLRAGRTPEVMWVEGCA
ncbi:MAG: hypothetical protein ACJ8AO_20340 [Gemmatimonadaceae bacterium]